MTESEGFAPDVTAAAALAEALETAERTCGCQAAARPPRREAVAAQEAPGEPVPVSPDPGERSDALSRVLVSREDLRAVLGHIGPGGFSQRAREALDRLSAAAEAGE